MSDYFRRLFREARRPVPTVTGNAPGAMVPRAPAGPDDPAELLPTRAQRGPDPAQVQEPPRPATKPAQRRSAVSPPDVRRHNDQKAAADTATCTDHTINAGTRQPSPAVPARTYRPTSVPSAAATTHAPLSARKTGDNATSANIGPSDPQPAAAHAVAETTMHSGKEMAAATALAGASPGGPAPTVQGATEHPPAAGPTAASRLPDTDVQYAPTPTWDRIATDARQPASAPDRSSAMTNAEPRPSTRPQSTLPQSKQTRPPAFGGVHIGEIHIRVIDNEPGSKKSVASASRRGGDDGNHDSRLLIRSL